LRGYLSQLDTAERQTAAGEAPSEELAARTTRLKEKLGSLESILAQPRAMLSDRNGDTARATAHGPHARIAARSGLIPTMFITRVRL
jgi:hypothetical protein